MSVVLALTALTSLPVTAAPGDAPMRLLTDHGIDLVADEQVFLLFAALNAAGYAEEPRRKGPPLDAPVFHPIREEVRDALREARERPSMAALRAVFDENPQPIPVYLEAVLSLAPGAPKAKGPAEGLAKKLAPLADFRSDANLEAVFDRVSAAQRKHMKELAAALAKDFGAARKVLGDDGFRAPRSLVVVPNPLDGHGLVRPLLLGGTTFLVVGPGLEAARIAVLEAALEPSLKEQVDKSYKNAKNLPKSWATLKTASRIQRQWPTGEAYMTAALRSAVAHRATAGAGTDADEAFIDAQAKEGMRWARVALGIIDDRGSSPLAQALPNLLAKAAP